MRRRKLAALVFLFPSAALGQKITSGVEGFNVLQVGGTATDTNSGLKSAGTLRVVLATDQPQLTNKLLVTPDSVALPANQSVDISRINAVTPLMGNGVTGTGSPRVTPSSDSSAIANWGHGATGSAVPSGATYYGANGSGNLTGLITCDNFTAINISTATTTKIIALASAKNTYICSFHLFSAGTDNAAWIQGTKTTTECDTTTVGLAGGTTAASGYNFTAQTGIAASGGIAPVIKTTATAKDVCIITSAAVQLSGAVAWTQF